MHGAIFVIITLVSEDIENLASFMEGFKTYHPGIELVTVAGGGTGLQWLTENSADVVIVDEQLGDMSGIDFVKQLVKKNPLINTAIVSQLNEEDFHHATEGLGVLMKLPFNPPAESAEQLFAILKKIGALLQPSDKKVQEVGRL